MTTPLPLLALALMLAARPAAAADPLYGWVTALGMRHCCTKGFRPCETECAAKGGCGKNQCPGETECVVGCVREHCGQTKWCQGTAASGPKPAVPMEVGPPARKEEEPSGGGDLAEASPDGEVETSPPEERENKGALPGPGRVSYTLKHAGGTAIRVRAALIGEKDGKVFLLKKTDFTQMSPEYPAALEYDVAPEEFERWSKKFGTLRIAVDYETEGRRERGKWVDSTEGDPVLSKTDANFLVNSTYHPPARGETASPKGN